MALGSGAVSYPSAVGGSHPLSERNRESWYWHSHDTYRDQRLINTRIINIHHTTSYVYLYIFIYIYITRIYIFILHVYYIHVYVIISFVYVQYYNPACIACVVSSLLMQMVSGLPHNEDRWVFNIRRNPKLIYWERCFCHRWTNNRSASHFRADLLLH